jgi:hypothetical protein
MDQPQTFTTSAQPVPSVGPSGKESNMSATNTATVRLHTIADLAATLGITGQQVSAFLKNDGLDTPVPSFAIYPTYGRRSVELLFTDSDIEAWVVFHNEWLASQTAALTDKVAKAQERAAKAQAAAEKALAAAAKAQAAVVDPDQLSLV